MKTSLPLVLMLLPLISSAQLSNSNIGATFGLQQNMNRVNSTRILNSNFTNGTIGILGALEWNIPIKNS